MKKLYKLLRTGRRLPALDLKSLLVVGLLLFAGLPSRDVLARNYIYQGIVVAGNVKDEAGAMTNTTHLMQETSDPFG